MFFYFFVCFILKFVFLKKIYIYMKKHQTNYYIKHTETKQKCLN